MTQGNQVEFSPIVIVIDTEPLGRGERAVIGTIGAVARNVMSKKDLGQFYTRINLELEQPGREIHEDVTEWWDGMAACCSVSPPSMTGYFLAPSTTHSTMPSMRQKSCRPSSTALGALLISILTMTMGAIRRPFRLNMV
ncbi:MAG: 3'-5' exoribonuclease domain-containing protein [Aeromonas sp.]